MNEYNVLGFDEVTGFNGGDDKPRRKRSDTMPMAQPPCETCCCSWVCSGAKKEGGAPDWTVAMACTIFKRFTLSTKYQKDGVKNANRMPSRKVYEKLFG